MGKRSLRSNPATISPIRLGNSTLSLPLAGEILPLEEEYDLLGNPIHRNTLYESVHNQLMRR